MADKMKIDEYRFLSGDEPTDEMLEQVMKEVAEEAVQRQRQATEAHWAQLELDIKRSKAKWAERIKAISNA